LKDIQIWWSDCFSIYPWTWTRQTKIEKELESIFDQIFSLEDKILLNHEFPVEFMEQRLASANETSSHISHTAKERTMSELDIPDDGDDDNEGDSEDVKMETSTKKIKVTNLFDDVWTLN